MLFSRSLRAICLALAVSATTLAQTASHPTHAQIAPAAVSAVLLSDLHLDPFHDPAKFPRLLASGASEWAAILAAPDSATIAADTAKLQAACPVRGIDTPPALLQSSLLAAHRSAPDALFAVVAGDLLSHAFDCRFKLLAPHATPDQYSAFAAKAAAFVALQLRHAFGSTPVYVALGNNDSGCGDYRETEGSPFLRALTQSLAAELTPATGSDELSAHFSVDGSYSVRLPAPIARGRLIVLQDLFQSAIYKDCSGQPNAAAPAAQLAWLRAQLDHARAAHEQVWVMAHVPPGINVYTTFSQKLDVCAGQKPVLFLTNDDLTRTLTAYADIVRLAIFAHTHNDEMHLLLPDTALPSSTTSPAGSTSPPPGPVAAKLTPSISPVNGNMPAFTIAQVDRRTANMDDYRVLIASNQTGIATQWGEEYQFSKLYGLTGYTPANITHLLDGFIADRDGLAKPSTDYAQMFYPGGGKGTLGVHLLWQQYSCANENHTAATYRACVCPAK